MSRSRWSICLFCLIRRTTPRTLYQQFLPESEAPAALNSVHNLVELDTTTRFPRTYPELVTMSIREENSDEFQKTEVPYALDRTGYAASGRLAFQHYLWKDVTGSLIHPDILADLRTLPTVHAADGDVQLNVADVGTGTGAWALDVARLSGTQGLKFNVHGFDISDDQFPPRHLLPQNVQFSVSDALAPPPGALHGTFDIVHIAHFACVRALGEDPSPAMKHAIALLKPGGWIQWDEWARDETGKVAMVRLAPSPRCDWALDVSSKIFPRWLLDIAGHLSNNGFEDAARHDFEPRNDLLPGLTLMWYLTADEVVRFGFEEPTKSMFLDALSAAYAETRDDSIRAMFKLCPSSVIGKKPAGV
ncbi:S-adenosyl-L-methionine-dependent methyltransferase [Bombardia bombarda]|uniref:S-adenosyl-L-methionine-dependent methyltransferase n=1 Tax=Bombardia bombarda TaxID=252184 RepID=A0AA39X914_9PEZI|nr:S-adenosyl-L-methionine-dependent methyltransferase [Bombardia bombarda]